MCLSRSGVRSISGLSRALRRNGAIALTSCTSSSSTVGTSASSRRHELRSRRSTCCRSWSSRPCGEEVAAAPASSSGSSGTCDSSAACEPDRARASAVARRRRACRSRAGPRTRRAAARTCAGMRARDAVSPLHHVRVELRRPPHGLAGVVDDEVEPVARGEQVAAERLDARRVPQIEPEDLEPVAPVAEVGLLRVARGGSCAESAS